jgi:hypothetical protein
MTAEAARGPTGCLFHAARPRRTRRRIAGQRGTYREGGRTAVDYGPLVLAGRLLLAAILAARSPTGTFLR